MAFLFRGATDRCVKQVNDRFAILIALAAAQRAYTQSPEVVVIGSMAIGFAT